MSIKVTYEHDDYPIVAFSGIGNEPTVTFDTEINRSSAGYIIGVIDKITLNGVIYSTGSLNNNDNYGNSNGAWKNLASDIRLLQTGLMGASGYFVEKVLFMSLIRNLPLSTVLILIILLMITGPKLLIILFLYLFLILVI